MVRDGYTMPSFCLHCDEFYDYRRLSNTKKCPNCGNELKYYDTDAIARKCAPVRARCMHCKLLGKLDCPEDKETIKPLYQKACPLFDPKKDAKYREGEFHKK